MSSYSTHKPLAKPIALAALAMFFAMAGCSSESANNSDRSSLKLVATTGQINAALSQLTEGTDCSIKHFCGPGVDPHSFSASSNDVQAMIDADLIIYNGFHLEAKLSEHLHGEFNDKSWSMASAFPEEARLDWVEDGAIDPNAPFDPHIWNHLPGWAKCVESLADRLATEDPANAEKYKMNAHTYKKKILKMHQWAKTKLDQIPKPGRTIVSAHDAFNYFAKAYEMETLAVLGIGNDPEADIKTMKKVAETICDQKIPAIFMESITNPKVTIALKEACESRKWQVELVDEPLYSDDIGNEAPQNSFLGAFESNVEIIFKSLNRYE